MGLLRIPRFARTSSKTNDHARAIPDICLPFNSSQPNDRIGVCDREGGILLVICPIGGKETFVLVNCHMSNCCFWRSLGRDYSSTRAKLD
jgi:hypothetical protein